MSLTLKNENGYTYAEEGHGAVVILLHGLMGGPENFAPVIPGLRHVCHVVIPCLPLFELPLRKANVKELVHFLRGFIAYKGYGSVILAGNSLGGHVALLYALKHPEGVRAMVLTGSSGLTENTMGTTIPRRKDYDYVREKAALTFYDPAVATKELVDSVFAVPVKPFANLTEGCIVTPFGFLPGIGGRPWGLGPVIPSPRGGDALF